jgi:polyhydroxyalkanoate synthesis regulator protein
MQSLVPSYLEVSMDSFSRDQQKLREQLAHTFGPGAFQAIDDQVRTNMAFFSEAMRMFTPFALRRAAGEAKAGEGGEIDTLKAQMAEMQAKLEALSRK